MSTWQLTAPTDTPGAQLLLEAENPRLVVATAPDVVFRSGPVIRIEREVGADGDLVTFTGVDDLIYLRWRLAHPQPATAAPPYNTQAFDTRTGSASVVIAEFVDVNAGAGAVAARRIPGLTAPVPAAAGPDHHRVRPLPEPADHAAAGGQPRPAWASRSATWSSPCSTPPAPARSSPPTWAPSPGGREAQEAPPVNYVYVAGGGRGVNRVIKEYDDGASVAAWGRIEGFDDRRDTVATAELDQAGAEVLAGHPHPGAAAGGAGHPLPAVHHRLAAGGQGHRRLRRAHHHRRHPRGAHRPRSRTPRRW